MKTSLRYYKNTKQIQYFKSNYKIQKTTKNGLMKI